MASPGENNKDYQRRACPTRQRSEGTDAHVRKTQPAATRERSRERSGLSREDDAEPEGGREQPSEQEEDADALLTHSENDDAHGAK